MVEMAVWYKLVYIHDVGRAWAGKQRNAFNQGRAVWVNLIIILSGWVWEGMKDNAPFQMKNNVKPITKTLGRVGGDQYKAKHQNPKTFKTFIHNLKLSNFYALP